MGISKWDPVVEIEARCPMGVSGRRGYGSSREYCEGRRIYVGPGGLTILSLKGGKGNFSAKRSDGK